MITLYRNISWKELAILLRDKRVEGQFNEEHKNNGYKSEYGKVVCCFFTYREYCTASGIIIKIEVPKERIIAEGVGVYKTENPLSTEISIYIKECYLPYYTLEETTFYSDYYGESVYDRIVDDYDFRFFAKDLANNNDWEKVKREAEENGKSRCFELFSIFYKNKEILQKSDFLRSIDLFQKGLGDVVNYEKKMVNRFYIPVPADIAVNQKVLNIMKSTKKEKYLINLRDYYEL